MLPEFSFPTVMYGIEILLCAFVCVLPRLYIQPPILEPFLSFFPSRATGRPVPPILVCRLWFSLFERRPPTAFTARSWPLPERPRRQPIHCGLLAVTSNFAVILKGSYFPVMAAALVFESRADTRALSIGRNVRAASSA